MTDNDTVNDTVPTGEERLRQRRRAWWRYLALAFAISLLAGFASGFLTGSYESGAVPLWLPVGVGVVVLALLAWFTRDYFRRIDELDLMDNLWAHLIGMYAAISLFAGWYFLADLGLAEHPAALPIVAAMLVFTMLAYGFRKLGIR